MPVLDYARADIPAPMQFRVLGPDGGAPSLPDLRRLFHGQRVTAARRARIARSGRILALCGNRVVGLAAYERFDRELRVSEVGLDRESACGADEVANGLLDALELACMASGARRLLLLPGAGLPGDVIRRRGYRTIADGAAGSWCEKRFA